MPPRFARPCKNRGYGGVGKRCPVNILRQLSLTGMAGDEAHRLGVVAMGQGNAEAGGHGACRGDAGHDIDGNVFSRQRGDLLTGAPENHRIAGFQAHHPFSRLCKPDHHVVDIFLPAAFAAAALANQHALGLPPRQLQHLG